jgi:amidophosphoribosyltransferase
MSSENHFFDELEYETIGELPHGSLLFPGTDPEYMLTEKFGFHPDVFEFVYLAKDGSKLYGVENTKVRYDLGFSAAMQLRDAHPEVKFTRIFAVPNGANIMRKGALQAYGMAENMPNGITRKPHSERSFMASEQGDREAIVRDKFILHPEHIVRHDILLIDDSIVRGTTMKILVDMLLEAGAKSVFVLPASPIVHYGDRYGIAMSTNELIGIDHVSLERLTTADIESRLFYDSLKGTQKARLFYPSVEKFLDVFKTHGLPQVHAAYFDGRFIAG